MSDRLVAQWLNLLAAEFPSEDHLKACKVNKPMKGPRRGVTIKHLGPQTEVTTEPERKIRK